MQPVDFVSGLPGSIPPIWRLEIVGVNVRTPYTILSLLAISWLILCGDACWAGEEISARVVWERTFQGDMSTLGSAVREAREGGYLVVGTTRSREVGHEMTYLYLLRTDRRGETLWERNFGGSASLFGNSILQAEDGGLFVVGTRRFPVSGKHSEADVYLLRTDSEGNPIFGKSFGRTGDDSGNCVRQTVDGGLIIAGLTQTEEGGQDAYLVKTDLDGTPLWAQQFGGRSRDLANAVLATADGEFIVVGTTQSFGAGKSDVFVVKTDAEGAISWQKTFGGRDFEFGQAVEETVDGDYIVTGWTYSFSDSSDVYLAKIDRDGGLVWERSLGEESDEVGNSVLLTADGGYLVAGLRRASLGGLDIYLLKADQQGHFLWSQRLGGGGDQVANSIRKTVDGGYVVAGYTASSGRDGTDAYLVKLDPESPRGTPFLRGDMDADGRRDITDAVSLLTHLMLGTLAPPCRKSADADDNGELEITDAVRVLVYLFLGGEELSAPHAQCGEDPTGDALDCLSYPPCR